QFVRSEFASNHVRVVGDVAAVLQERLPELYEDLEPEWKRPLPQAGARIAQIELAKGIRALGVGPGEEESFPGTTVEAGASAARPPVPASRSEVAQAYARARTDSSDGVSEISDDESVISTESTESTVSTEVAKTTPTAEVMPSQEGASPAERDGLSVAERLYDGYTAQLKDAKWPNEVWDAQEVMRKYSELPSALRRSQLRAVGAVIAQRQMGLRLPGGAPGSGSAAAGSAVAE
ncbi:hypothetical protein, partial [Actinoallomurus spadix]|uniref:hypothetical protein n=1 Tax=Actinoallomurus spadix TaxID=79912 RepID=UPI0031E16E09